jgi:hypothetical protein
VAREEQAMIGWDKRDWVEEVTDPRDQGDPEGAYEKYMEANKFSLLHQMGDPDGYGYELWGKSNEKCWIVALSDGNSVEEVLVIGYPNLADIMSHLGPGAIAAVLDGEEMGQLWLERKEHRENMQALRGKAEQMLNQVFNNGPCDCPRCTERREKERAEAN